MIYSDLLDLGWSLCPPILLQMALFHSFLWLSSRPLSIYATSSLSIHLSVIIYNVPWWRRQWHPTPVLLPGKSHGRGSLVGCSPRSPEESDTTERLHFHFHALEKERATHSSVLAWRIPGMGEPGGLPSMGLHRLGHDWRDSAAAAAADFLSAMLWNYMFNVILIFLPYIKIPKW